MHVQVNVYASHFDLLPSSPPAWLRKPNPLSHTAHASLTPRTRHTPRHPPLFPIRTRSSARARRRVGRRGAVSSHGTPLPALLRIDRPPSSRGPPRSRPAARPIIACLSGGTRSTSPSPTSR